MLRNITRIRTNCPDSNTTKSSSKRINKFLVNPISNMSNRFSSTSEMLSPVTEHVITEEKQSTLYVKLNNPVKKNPFSMQVSNKIAKSFNDANSNDSIKAVVLTGVGDYFTSGNDLGNFIQCDEHPEGRLAGLKVLRQVLVQMVESFINLQKPLIAVINGPSVGIGLTSLPLCDYVIASDKATFHAPFTIVGMCPEACSSITFPRLMGRSRATGLLLLNRKINANQAKDYGLVSDVVEGSKLSEYVDDLLHGKGGLITDCLPNSVKAGKSLICNDDVKRELKEANIRECDRILECWAGQECQDAVLKFLTSKTKVK